MQTPAGINWSGCWLVQVGTYSPPAQLCGGSWPRFELAAHPSPPPTSELLPTRRPTSAPGKPQPQTTNTHLSSWNILPLNHHIIHTTTTSGQKPLIDRPSPTDPLTLGSTNNGLGQKFKRIFYGRKYITYFAPKVQKTILEVILIMCIMILWFIRI